MTAWFCVNWSMTCSSTVERPETALGLVTEGYIVVSDHMLISILSMSVETLEISCVEAVDDDLQSPKCLMCNFRK